MNLYGKEVRLSQLGNGGERNLNIFHEMIIIH